MVNSKQIVSLILLYLGSRLLSFLCPPGQIINSILSLAVLTTAMYFLLKKDKRGWYIIILEFILGGGGGFFSLGELSLRTCLLILTITVLSFQILKDKNFKTLKENYFVFCLLSLFYLLILLASLNGYLAENNLKLIIADAIPYFFFFYYFTSKKIFNDQKIKKLTINALVAAIFGNLIMIVITFTLYSTQLFIIHDQYYRWFRDIAGGKITDLNSGFFRIVLNEQLLLIPVLIYFLNDLLLKGQKILMDKKIKYLAIISLLILLAINLSRIYILALIIGLLFLFRFSNYKRWLIISLSTIIIFVFSFSALYFVASRGQSLGWEVFGLRIQSIARPNTEASSLSRMILLPKIWEKIQARPLMGHGLGQSILVYNPIIKQEVITSQFDWGYLEIQSELGLIGSLIWGILISYLIYRLIKSWPKKQAELAMLSTLLIINLTSPALFHVLGVVLLTYILISVKK